MRKLILLNILLLLLQAGYAQINPGNWIRTKVTYKDGVDLDDTNPLKYMYLRYSFEKGANIRISNHFNSKGYTFTYAITDNVLQIKNTASIVNEFKIESSNDSSLVLLQKGFSGFESDDCMRFYFITERKFQANYTPTSEDIFSISGADTLFIANSKLYPVFKGDKDHFDVLKQGVPSQPSANLHFLATFIVKKNGEADSLKIIESFDPDFDKRIIKNFNKTKQNWQAAFYKGKPVNVQMQQEYKYFSSNTMLPAYDYGKKGLAAMTKQDYTAAIYYFDIALSKVPSDADLLYKRAVCKHELGNVDGACKDLNAIKLLGKPIAKELLEKWCK